MDIFKIGENLKRNMILHFGMFRQTGRTRHLVNSLRDGDLVVFASRADMLEVQRLLINKNTKVNLIVISPLYFDEKDERLRGHRGRVIFDHFWIEEYYAHSIEQASNVIQNASKVSYVNYEKCFEEYQKNTNRSGYFRTGNIYFDPNSRLLYELRKIENGNFIFGGGVKSYPDAKTVTYELRPTPSFDWVCNLVYIHNPEKFPEILEEKIYVGGLKVWKVKEPKESSYGYEAICKEFLEFIRS